MSSFEDRYPILDDTGYEIGSLYHEPGTETLYLLSDEQRIEGNIVYDDKETTFLGYHDGVLLGKLETFKGVHVTFPGQAMTGYLDARDEEGREVLSEENGKVRARFTHQKDRIRIDLFPFEKKESVMGLLLVALTFSYLTYFR